MLEQLTILDISQGNICGVELTYWSALGYTYYDCSTPYVGYFIYIVCSELVLEMRLGTSYASNCTHTVFICMFR